MIIVLHKHHFCCKYLEMTISILATLRLARSPHAVEEARMFPEETAAPSGP